MKKASFLWMLILLSALVLPAHAQDEIISLFEGSTKIYDDDIGYGTHYYLTGPTSHKAVDGKMRRQFCELPEGVSAYEVIKNYEKAIQSKGGTIIHLSRNAKRYTDEDSGETIRFIEDLFTIGRITRYNPYSYLQFPNYAQDYVSGKISTAENDIYISVAAAAIEKETYYTLVTVLAEPMDMDNVTLNVLDEGIANEGKIAIYDIYFDTGKSEVKEESSNALSIIANYLKENSDKKFIVVGHTDNTGDFNANVTLSNDRAKAVIEKLVTEYGIDQAQLIPYGVASVSPQMSNATDEGRERNRRVELVEF